MSEATARYYHDPDGRKRRAREKRITELMAQAAAGKAFPGAPIDRAFWEIVHDNEEAPLTTDFKQLRAAGFELPAPDALDDAALSAKLRDLVDELRKMHVELFDAEGFDDRTIYTALFKALLHEERHDIPLDASSWTIDVGSWIDEEEGDDEEAAEERRSRAL